MMDKRHSHSEIVRIASEVAIEVYSKEKTKEKKMQTDRRFRDAKRLIRNYREIKLHAGDAIASLSEVDNEDFDFFKSMVEERGEIDVASIVVSRAKSAIMLTHIDAMIHTYQTICLGSKKAEEQRRYRVLESMCLCDNTLTAQELAERENVDLRTIYRDFDTACEKMSALLFGIQWIEREP